MKPIDVDIADVLDDVAGVLRERETGRSQSYRSEVREVNDIVYLLPGAWQSIADSLLALDQSLSPPAEPGYEVRLSPVGRVFARLKGILKRLIKKSVYWYVNPVVAQLHSMHSATDRALHEIADQLRSVNARLEAIEKENVSRRVERLEGERFEERIGRLEREWRRRSAGFNGGGEGESSGPRADLKEPGALAGGEGAACRGRRTPGPPFHFDYYWFESIHRGDRELIKKRQQPYLRYFTGCRNVLDVGCGRGEFLELMSEKGIGGYGIDIEGDAVQFCLDAGLPAVRAEAIEHIVGLEKETLDGVFLSQVVEHLTPDELIGLVGLLYEKVKPGGYVVVETPNPQCLLIFASFFYADLSHVQPIHPETMRFLLLSAGFRDVEINLTNPVPRNQRLSRLSTALEGADGALLEELNDNIEKLNSVLYGYMDYVAVARK